MLGSLNCYRVNIQQQPIVTCWLLGQPGAAQYDQPLAEIASTQHNAMPASDKFNIFSADENFLYEQPPGCEQTLDKLGIFHFQK